MRQYIECVSIALFLGLVLSSAVGGEVDVGRPVASVAFEDAHDSPSDLPPLATETLPPPSSTVSHSSEPSKLGGGSLGGLVIILDCCHSMALCTPQTGKYTRFSIAQWAVYDLLDSVPDGFPTALVFIRPDTPGGRELEPLNWTDKSQLRRSVMRVTPAGVAPLADALGNAAVMIGKKPPAKVAIVVITDGDKCGVGQAHRAASDLRTHYRVVFHVVAVAPVPIAAAQLESLAGAGGGAVHTVRAVGDLAQALAPVTARLDQVRSDRARELQNLHDNLRHCEADKARLQRHLERTTRERDLARREIVELEKALHATTVRLKCCEDEKAQLEQQLAKTASDLAHVKAELERCDRHARHLAGELHEAQHALEECRRTLLERDAQLRCCEEEKGELHRHLAAVTDELMRVKNELESCNRCTCELTKKLEACEDRHAKTEARLNSCEEERRKLQSENVDLKKALFACEQHLCTVQNERDQACAQIVNLTEQLRCCQSELKDTTQRLRTAESDRDRFRSELEQSAKDNQELTQRLNSANQSVATLRERVKGLETERDSLKVQLLTCEQNCRAQLATVEAERDRARAERDAFSVQVNELKQLLAQCQKECEMEKLHLESLLADARQAVIGATREMAANKRDVLHDHHGTSPVIVGPTVTPSNPYSSHATPTPSTATPTPSTATPSTPTPTTSSTATPISSTPTTAIPAGSTPTTATPTTVTPTTSTPSTTTPTTTTPTTTTPTTTTPTTVTPTTTTPTTATPTTATPSSSAPGGGAPADGGGDGLGGILGGLGLGLGLGLF